MTQPTPQTIRRRLERAGYAHVAGWVPVEYARSMQALVEQHREDVATIVAEPARLKGWPKGKPRKPAD